MSFNQKAKFLKKYAMLPIVAFILFILIPVSLFATTYHIKLDGTGNFTTIQEGINASTDIDTVLVYPGTYYENLDFNGKNIMLGSLELTTGNSQYVETTIIDGQRQESCIRIHNGETNARVQGFTITNGFGTLFWSEDGGGILVHDYSTVYVTNCMIRNNIATLGAGLYARHGFIHLSGVTLKENHACVGGALYLDDDSMISFDDDNLCDIYNNNAGRGADIYTRDSGLLNVIVDTFTVSTPSRFFAEFIDDSSIDFTIQHNWMELVPNDLYVAPYGCDDNSGLTPQEPLKNISWAVRRIQADEANPRTIHVASGTYSWQDNQQVYPIGCKEYVSVIGENMDNAILYNDYNTVAIVGSNVQGKIEFSNLSINNCSDYFTWSASFFYEIEFLKMSNIKIQYNSNIRNIFSSEHVYNELENILISDNIVNVDQSSNSGFGLHSNTGYIKNCIIASNENLSPYSYSPEVAMQLAAAGDFLVENSVFTCNQSDNSEGRIIRITNCNGNEPVVTFNNCLIADNSIGSNYVIQNFNYDGLTEFNNCTIANNSSEAYTLYNCGDLNLTNTIMYNPANGIEIYMRDDTQLNGNIYTLNVDNSNIWGGLTGGVYNQNSTNNINWNEGNLNEIPNFVGTGNDPYQLSEVSSCIDTGTPDTTGLFLPPWDLLNNHRIWDGDGNGTEIIDMGCYEYGAEPFVEISNNELPITNYKLTNYPNPFNPSTTIAFNLIESGKVKVEIFNIKGQKVKTLMECITVPGNYQCVWNGKNDAGKRISSGEYFAKLKLNGEEVTVRKMLLMK